MIKTEHLPIRDRILGLADKMGVHDLKRGGRLARSLGVHNSVIKRLLDNQSLPGAENLKKICEHAQVSADYILFGRVSAPQTGEFQEVLYDVRMPAQVDIPLLARALAAVNDTIKAEKLKLDELKTSRLAGLVYEHCSKEKEKPDIVLVKRYLLLTD
jgi:transcriptional regulator with XRE-family HTH domain